MDLSGCAWSVSGTQNPSQDSSVGSILACYRDKIYRQSPVKLPDIKTL